MCLSSLPFIIGAQIVHFWLMESSSLTPSPFDVTLVNFNSFLLSCMSRRCTLILYISCPKAGISYFSSYFSFPEKEYFKTAIWVLGVLFATDLDLVSRSLFWTKVGEDAVYIHIKSSLSLLFFFKYTLFLRTVLNLQKYQEVSIESSHCPTPSFPYY